MDSPALQASPCWHGTDNETDAGYSLQRRRDEGKGTIPLNWFYILENNYP